MRNATFFILLLVPGATHAQNFPFPDSAALWVQSFYYMVVPPPLPVFELQAAANIQVNGADTMINAISYSKLTDVLLGTYYGALRDDGGQVWHVPVDSTQEYLLYDFTAQVGDTLQVIMYAGFPSPGAEPGFSELVVQNVYYDPDHENRRTMEFAGGGARWYEGIGCEYGLLAETWPNISNYFVALECMSHFDTVRYSYNGIPIGEPVPCTPLDMGVAPRSSGMEVRAYPNPTFGSITVRIAGPTDPLDISITDTQGRSLQVPVLRHADGIDLDLTALPDGIYVLRLRHGALLRTERVVKMSGTAR